MNKKSIGYINDDNNILEVFVELQSDNSIRFYDKSDNLLAVFIKSNNLIVSKDYRDKPPEFLNQINSLWKNILENSILLEVFNRDRDNLSEELNLDENSLILSSTSANLNQEIDKNKLHLSDEKDTSDVSDKKVLEQNRKNLEVSDIREETKLNTLVDDHYTLGQLLGVDDPNGSLVCVNSDSISGNTSHSKFTFLIKHSDGSLENAEMLSQKDGLDPNREVYASNRDGSSVEKVPVRSMYRFTLPTGQEAMVSVSYGEVGTLKFHYGLVDKTNNNKFIAVPLETNTTRYVTKEVQENLEPEKGIYRSTNSLDEIEYHTEKGCSDLTLKEADGIEGTGHQHLDEDSFLTIAQKILDENPSLDEFYSPQGLANSLKDYVERHSDLPTDKIIENFTEDTLEDCQHLKSRMRQ